MTESMAAGGPKPALPGFVLAGLLAGLAAFGSLPARADEPLFGYSYTTDLLPRGKWEAEQWVTSGLAQSRGDYNLLGFREELEYGVRSNLQLGMYVNWLGVSANRNGVDGATSGPGVPATADPSRRYASTRFDSVSFEAIWRLLSPYKDPVGLALYLEPAIGPDLRALEGKLIVQKNFLQDQLVWAANLSLAPEWKRKWATVLDPAAGGARRDWEGATEVEFTTGLSYRFAPGWFGGIEFRNHNEFAKIGFGHPEHSAFFLGPTVHYAGERFWATFTMLPQLPFAQAYNADQRAVRVGGRMFGDEHQALELRLRAGWLF